MTDVIIIGAGACGLMAARDLLQAGKTVLILEARNRLGGRIYTIPAKKFSVPVDAGAEFIHGSLPLTTALLQEAGINIYLLEGKNYQVKNNILTQSEEFIPEFDHLMQQLTSLKQDIPFADFLDTYLSGEQYTELREAAVRFAEGYDAADIKKASSFALREEWLTEGAANSYLPVGGYGQLITYLAEEVKAKGGIIELQSQATHINWKPGNVEVTIGSQKTYRVAKVIITAPLGVLQAEPGSENALTFSPTLPDKTTAWQSLGFGAVIKIVLEFKTSFWENSPGETKILRAMPDLAFLFTDASPYSAWWTRAPQKLPVISGWLAGIQAEKRKNLSKEEILHEALTTLAGMFQTQVTTLQTLLKAYEVINWAADPFARGAYAYATVNGTQARQKLNEPESNTLFFAGEALYEGPAMGTVEAALVSGKITAGQILQIASK